MQLAAGVIDGELPGDGGALLVASGLPGGDLGGEGVAVRDAAAEALAGEHRELHLGHVQPTAVDRGVVELQLAQDPPRLVRRERLVQRGRGVGVQVVQDDADAVASGKWRSTRSLASDWAKSCFGAALGHLDVAPAAARLDEQEQVGGPVADVLGIEPLGVARFHRQRDAGLGHQLLARSRRSRRSGGSGRRARRTGPAGPPSARRTRPRRSE